MSNSKYRRLKESQSNSKVVKFDKHGDVIEDRPSAVTVFRMSRKNQDQVAKECREMAHSKYYATSCTG